MCVFSPVFLDFVLLNVPFLWGRAVLYVFSIFSVIFVCFNVYSGLLCFFKVVFWGAGESVLLLLLLLLF